MSINLINPINHDSPIIIGIDHGYGNIKTAHCCFKTGVAAYDKEPTFKTNLLVYEGRFHLIGEEHKEFAADKMADSDYYILTLAAIGRELNIRRQTSARVHIAAGLPLTWVSEQKDSFRAYLLKNEAADFNFKGVDYHVEFAGADVFPQGFSAVADRLREFRGVNMLCDIGNGTMNVMYINECRPVTKLCFTEKYGTHQCMLAVRESLMRQFGTAVDDALIERVIRHGTADISDRYLTAIRETASEYVAGIFRRLREHEYDPELMRLYVVGGGSCMVKNFGQYDAGRVIINDDICATAKGYELLAESKLRKEWRCGMSNQNIPCYGDETITPIQGNGTIGKQIYTTTIRLNLGSDDDRRAWEYLRHMNKWKHHSINKAIVTAVNDYFSRMERMSHDSYLETREKEDAFLRQIQKIIERSLQTAAPAFALGSLIPLLQGGQPASVVPVDDEDNMDAALDFANSF